MKVFWWISRIRLELGLCVLFNVMLRIGSECSTLYILNFCFVLSYILVELEKNKRIGSEFMFFDRNYFLLK